MGYPSDILSTRAVIRPGKYVVIPPEGLVNNVIPGIENCRVSIVASPKYGASFVQYLITAQPGGGTSRPFGREEGIEVFFYVQEGTGYCPGRRGRASGGGRRLPLYPGRNWHGILLHRGGADAGRSSTSSGISRQKG